MRDIYELKERLCDELKEYGKKGDMSTGSLDVVDKLARTVKNLDKIIEAYEEEGYSGRYMPSYAYDDGMSRRSFARGRSARRDSMGRYSSRYSRDGMADKLRELMEEAPDERTRDEIRRLAEKVETM